MKEYTRRLGAIGDTRLLGWGSRDPYQKATTNCQLSLWLQQTGNLSKKLQEFSGSNSQTILSIAALGIMCANIFAFETLLTVSAACTVTPVITALRKSYYNVFSFVC
ncbi:hypothetical protein T265_02663 [Opisthorchis viverrini]|uniref:Uncharacterized protein n=1 Tax=Opisthorchis viverrini TaxID=6198 RepID=A0A074ZU27_OPIVI|nr:hypothetical protein T265_02663 [Opisthorchis viverrini]KER30983.1 hypothetical protein T265_02663 [Opisthorchis viverrini]